MKSYHYIFYSLLFLYAVFICDQSTLKDCAIKGYSKMAGGGTIKCEIVTEKHETTIKKD